MNTPTDRTLPPRANLDYLKKLAKDKLAELRQHDPDARLHQAQLAVARAYNFPSWRALKAEIDAIRDDRFRPLREAIERNDAAGVTALLKDDPSLIDTPGKDDRQTALHLAAIKGHTALVQVLLEHGADCNVRDAGDNAYPLHFAAELGHMDTVKLLVEAGADIRGGGDRHGLGVIGWATCRGTVRTDIAHYLLDRGAQHHVFSAVAMGDVDAVRVVVDRDPSSVMRNMSVWESHRLPLHLAVITKQYAVLDLLAELGADLEAVDKYGRTAMDLAVAQDDQSAIRRLAALGAMATTNGRAEIVFAGMTPIFNVKNVPRSIDYYVDKLGFKKDWEWGDPAGFASVSRGEARIFLCQDGQGGPGTWLSIFVDNVDALHQQYVQSGATIRQPPTTFPWGMREMNIEDLDGHRLRIGHDTNDPPDNVNLAED